MTKIDKATKLKPIIEYFQGTGSIKSTAHKYGISRMLFLMLVSAYRVHGPDVILEPPKITPEFRIKLASWAIHENASYTEVAAKFGYVGVLQIHQWKEIYRNEGPSGLMSITREQKPTMDKKQTNKKKNKLLTPEQERIK